jgi:hypothetical protein
MKTFACQCSNRVFFLNTHCVNCNRALGYFPRLGRMGALEPAGQYTWISPGVTPAGSLYRQCNNYAAEDVCNWMVEDTDSDPFCWSCRLNQIIPDLSRPRHRYYWYKIEAAKRYMLYGLYQLRLPVVSKKHDPDRGLAFTFLADTDSEAGFSHPLHSQIHTGHRNGLITINLAEADDVARTRMREQMQERYRTLLGHFRHEIGHYYWDRLVRDLPATLAAYRELFGDERRDYPAALDLHYRQGPPAGWEQHYVSGYASAHPWEDWAECWAHYMHMIDTLETAHAFGLVPAGVSAMATELPQAEFNPSHEDFARLLERWVQLTVAMNALSRSMGLPDAYPFVLPGIARRKLEFIHHLIAGLNNGT